MRPESSADRPALRAAFESSGSGAWLMRTILAQGLDRRHGFSLDLRLGDDRVRGDRQATEARLIAGEVDLIDTDWLSIARHRSAGLPLLAAAPYGAIFGALVARPGAGMRGLADLRGRRIGVVHPRDKNWLLLRAACRGIGFDPAETCTVEACGSKGSLAEALGAGSVDAALLYWHQVPALLAAGTCDEVCDLLELLPPGRGRGVPSTFFVFREDFVAQHADTVQAFRGAAAEAAALLRDDEALWRHMSGVDAAVADGLRRRWMARVGLPWKPAMAADLQALARWLLGIETTARSLLAPGLLQ